MYIDNQVMHVIFKANMTNKLNPEQNAGNF